MKPHLLAGHPRFFNQLSCGLDITSLAGEWLTATANTNMFTYEIAPVFILMEHEVLKKMREIIGFQSGDSILAPGGSISNMYALMVARHKLFPQHKKYGMRAIKGQLMMYTSQHHHYSIKGGASAIGLGLDNCVQVACDERSVKLPSLLLHYISSPAFDFNPVLAFCNAFIISPLPPNVCYVRPNCCHQSLLSPLNFNFSEER